MYLGTPFQCIVVQKNIPGKNKSLVIREHVKKKPCILSVRPKKCNFFFQNKKKFLECSETKEYAKIFCGLLAKT